MHQAHSHGMPIPLSPLAMANQLVEGVLEVRLGEPGQVSGKDADQVARSLC